MTALNEVTEFTVQYVNPPKEGKKWGSIKSSEGDSYFGPPSMLREFSVGEVCKVEWKPFGENAKAIVKKLYNGEIKPKQVTRPAAAPREARQIGIFAAAKLVQPVPFGTVDEMTHAITSILLAASRSYDRVLAGAQTQAREDMDDEIPF